MSMAKPPAGGEVHQTSAGAREIGPDAGFKRRGREGGWSGERPLSDVIARAHPHSPLRRPCSVVGGNISRQQ
jgi:hypothetical protein